MSRGTLSLVFSLLVGCDLFDPTPPVTDFDADGHHVPDDCDDRDPGIYPGHGEDCDGADEDCDGTIDDGWDQDADGATPCSEAPDCDDQDATVGAHLPEVCDGVDNDCDTILDEDCGADGDGDGWNSFSDCDDADPNVHPDAIEYCNGRDDNCDGATDEGFDGDADLWDACGDDADCNDADDTIHPEAAELCDGIDQDCDERVDENFDSDQDGRRTCDSPPDCDDLRPTVYPGAPELCDAIDNDCDAAVDEGATGGDGDGDGYSVCDGDCNDADATIHPGASDPPGLPDSDCSGGGGARYSGPSPATILTPTASGTEGRLGDRLAVGDFNGDGRTDLAAASPTWNGGRGRVSLFIGPSFSAASPPATLTAFATITGTTANGFLGWSVTFSDANGDGYDDLIVGEPEINTASPPYGGAYLYFGGPILTSGEWPPAAADVRIVGTFPTEQCGTAVAGLGDVNGDGFGDFAIGCPWYNPAAQGFNGRAAVFMGRASWAGTWDMDDANASVVGDAADVEAGAAIVGPGDMNGDGFDDLAVASPGWSAGSGRVGLWLGAASGWAPNRSFGSLNAVYTGSGAEGLTVIAGADLNGDARADLLAAGPDFNAGRGIIYGMPGFVSPPATGAFSAFCALGVSGSQASEAASAAATTDLDGDGARDLVVGAPLWDGSSGGDHGSAYILYGPISALGATNVGTAAASITGATAGDGLGTAVIEAPDFNGDGAPDVFISAPYQDGGGPNGGRIYLLLGV